MSQENIKLKIIPPIQKKRTIKPHNRSWSIFKLNAQTEKGVWRLVLNSYSGSMFVACLCNDNKWHTYNNDIVKNVTHFRKLPGIPDNIQR